MDINKHCDEAHKHFRQLFHEANSNLQLINPNIHETIYLTITKIENQGTLDQSKSVNNFIGLFSNSLILFF